MKRQKWMRSMKPDEMWTTSILHIAGWLVHAVGALRVTKNLQIQGKHAPGAFV